MDQSFDAIYENGVFRPITPVDLPENARVRVQPATAPSTTSRAERLDRLAGSLADLPHWEEDLAELYAERLNHTHRDESL